MRIALVCDWYPPRLGGIEAHLSELGARLFMAGHDVHVITSTPGPSGRSGTGAHVHRLSASRLPFAEVVFQAAAIAEIGRIIETEKIELVHSHISIVSPVAIGGTAEAQRRGVPTVVTFHSFIPATPVWAWMVGRLVGASNWKAVMTAVSSRVAAEMRTFAPSAQIQVLPNAIDAEFWTPGGQADHAGVNLVAVGRLQAKKRPMVLIESAKHIRTSLPAKKFTLRIAGSGPLEATMRRAIEREGLADCVEFVGWKSADDLRALLRESDVFLSPAVRESFGIAALEARAVGLPVIAMAQSAVPDFITDEESGLLAASDREFLDATTRLVRDDALRGKMTKHNRSVRTELTWEKAVRAHEAVYASAVALSAAKG